MLLRSTEVRTRIHKLIFSARDTFSAIGGIGILKERFDLVPDALSGICSNSPLGIRELQTFTDIPIFNNINRNLQELASILI